jgi:glutamine amidotransferase
MPNTVITTPQRADTSDEAAQLLAHPLKVTDALAHIRKATIGHIEAANCHPFVAQDATQRSWTLMHKGTVFGYDPLSPYARTQAGSTDSERVLLYLIDQLNLRVLELGVPLNADERFAVFSEVTAAMSPGNALALIVFDGERFFVYANYEGALQMASFDHGIVLCTSALSAATLDTPAPALSFKPIPLCTPFVLAAGSLVRFGAKNNHVYTPRDEDTRYLYQDYAAL